MNEKPEPSSTTGHETASHDPNVPAQGGPEKGGEGTTALPATNHPTRRRVLPERVPAWTLAGGKHPYISPMAYESHIPIPRERVINTD